MNPVAVESTTPAFKKIMRVVLPFAFLVAIGGFMPVSAATRQSVKLAWNPSNDPTVTGYSVYYGVASGVYTSKVTAGNQTTATISGLTAGATYYFVVTAYDAAGLESRPSNQVAYTVAGVRLSIQKVHLSWYPTAFLVSGTGTPPAQWALQASPDMKTWRTLARGTNSAVSALVLVYQAPTLFFRVTGP